MSQWVIHFRDGIGYAFGTKKRQEEVVRIVQEAPILTEGAAAHADRFILVFNYSPPGWFPAYKMIVGRKLTRWAFLLRTY